MKCSFKLMPDLWLLSVNVMHSLPKIYLKSHAWWPKFKWLLQLIPLSKPHSPKILCLLLNTDRRDAFPMHRMLAEICFQKQATKLFQLRLLTSGATLQYLFLSFLCDCRHKSCICTRGWFHKWYVFSVNFKVLYCCDKPAMFSRFPESLNVF